MRPCARAQATGIVFAITPTVGPRNRASPPPIVRPQCHRDMHPPYICRTLGGLLSSSRPSPVCSPEPTPVATALSQTCRACGAREPLSLRPRPDHGSELDGISSRGHHKCPWRLRWLDVSSRVTVPVTVRVVGRFTPRVSHCNDRVTSSGRSMDGCARGRRECLSFARAIHASSKSSFRTRVLETSSCRMFRGALLGAAGVATGRGR
mmetsp:Transcript_18263/g.42507  ORF Transcript_18263/g.42507 Transcript_18263/m.42507 type:complete len:207 (-) Transcript_18263:7-627(-)